MRYIHRPTGGGGTSEDEGNPNLFFVCFWIVGLLIVWRVAWEPIILSAVWSLVVPILAGLAED